MDFWTVGSTPPLYENPTYATASFQFIFMFVYEIDWWTPNKHFINCLKLPKNSLISKVSSTFSIKAAAVQNKRGSVLKPIELIPKKISGKRREQVNVQGPLMTYGTIF